jgi:hypothetical protein
MVLLPSSCTCKGGVDGGAPVGLGPPGGLGGAAEGGVGMTIASFFKWSSRMVFWVAGLEMTLAVGVSRRMLPLLERHMRDADWVGGLPPGACVLVAQSEQDGGIGGGAGWSITR